MAKRNKGPPAQGKKNYMPGTQGNAYVKIYVFKIVASFTIAPLNDLLVITVLRLISFSAFRVWFKHILFMHMKYTQNGLGAGAM